MFARCFVNSLLKNSKKFVFCRYIGNRNVKSNKMMKVGGFTALGCACAVFGRRLFFTTNDNINNDNNIFNISNINTGNESTTKYQKVNNDLIPEGNFTFDPSHQKFTFYQYRNCPFCNKVRSYLDYRGFPYDAVDVHFLTKKEMKGLSTQKIPLLLLENEDNEKLEITESSLIISLLETYVVRRESLSTLLNYYPIEEEKDDKGRRKKTYSNKYVIMFQDDEISNEQQQQHLINEREWRTWIDLHFVRLLPPNIYRSLIESYDSLKNFKNITERDFTILDKFLFVYVGALAMCYIGRKLKKKYSIEDDVRIPLYKACDTWVSALKGQPFHGGNVPSLADVELFGVLRSIEGCRAFKDIISHTSIKDWYRRMEDRVTSHAGSILKSHSAQVS